MVPARWPAVAGRGRADPPVISSPGAVELADLAERREVAAVDLWWVSLPLLNVHRAAHGIEVDRQVVVVRLTLADGSEGWGECPTLSRPTYSNEYTAAAFALLRDEVVPWLLGSAGAVPIGHPMAVAAVITAHLDARLRTSDTALVDRLASNHGRPAGAVARTSVVGRTDDVDRLVEVVAERIAQGAAMIKLKAGPQASDIDAVAAVRSTWPDLALAVDGNGTLDVRSASMLDGLGLTYLEQPLPADDLVGLAGLARRLSCPLALDESVTSVAVLEAALALGSGSVVNVKPARLGGPRGAAGLARVATDAGWGVFVGGMLETGVGRAAALAVAALPSVTLPTDLGPSSHYFSHDLTESLECDGEGRLLVPNGPGIGVTPDEGRLADATVRHHRSSPQAR